MSSVGDSPSLSVTSIAWASCSSSGSALACGSPVYSSTNATGTCAGAAEPSSGGPSAPTTSSAERAPSSWAWLAEASRSASRACSAERSFAHSATVSISGVGSFAGALETGGAGVSGDPARRGRMHCSITTSSSPGTPSQRMSPFLSSVPSRSSELSLT